MNLARSCKKCRPHEEGKSWSSRANNGRSRLLSNFEWRNQISHTKIPGVYPMIPTHATMTEQERLMEVHKAAVKEYRTCLGLSNMLNKSFLGLFVFREDTRVINHTFSIIYHETNNHSLKEIMVTGCCSSIQVIPPWLFCQFDYNACLVFNNLLI